MENAQGSKHGRLNSGSLTLSITACLIKPTGSQYSARTALVDLHHSSTVRLFSRTMLKFGSVDAHSALHFVWRGFVSSSYRKANYYGKLYRSAKRKCAKTGQLCRSLKKRKGKRNGPGGKHKLRLMMPRSARVMCLTSRIRVRHSSKTIVPGLSTNCKGLYISSYGDGGIPICDVRMREWV